MLFNICMFILGIAMSVVVVYSYDTYLDNQELKKQVEELKKDKKGYLRIE